MLSDDVRLTLQASLPLTLPADALDRLAAGAYESESAPGDHLYREGDGRFTFLILRGLVRMYMRSPAGQEITVRYVRSGELTGLSSVFSDAQPLNFQALTATRALHLIPGVIDAAARADARVAYAFATQSSRSLVGFQREIGLQAFLSVRQRVARHLLDLATPAERGLTVRISQQSLADAVGTVREVVARTLHDLRKAGLIETSTRGIVLLDPEALQVEVSASRR
jgi:CRP/FNR family transcriptional regulator, cyclic AMP receptor protein